MRPRRAIVIVIASVADTTKESASSDVEPLSSGTSFRFFGALSSIAAAARIAPPRGSLGTSSIPSLLEGVSFWGDPMVFASLGGRLVATYPGDLISAAQPASMSHVTMDRLTRHVTTLIH